MRSRYVIGRKQDVTSWREVFPDSQLIMDRISAGSNKATMERTFTGTYQGVLMGFAAIGKEVKYSGITQ